MRRREEGQTDYLWLCPNCVRINVTFASEGKHKKIRSMENHGTAEENGQVEKKESKKIHVNISEAGASDSSSLNPLRIVKLNQTQTQQQSG